MVNRESADLSFSEKESLKNARYMFLYQAQTTNGEDIYAYMVIEGNMLEKFRDAHMGSSLDLTKYGEIVAGGYGKPTEEVMKEMEEKYGCKHNDILNFADLIFGRVPEALMANGENV